MTQIYIDPNGVRHEFPDDATPDEIDQATSGPAATSQPPVSVEGSSPDASAPTAPASQPSFVQRMLSGWAQQPRILSNALTGGLSDVASGAVRSLFPGGGTVGENIRQQQAMTQAGKEQIGTIPSMALETAGTALGPGKLSAASRMTGMLPRVAASAGENAALSGFEANLQGQDVRGPMLKGAVGGAVAPVIGGVLSKAASGLPESMGGKVAVPTSADLLAQPGFKTADVYRRADLLDSLQNMRYNAKNAASSLPAQTHSFLSRDPLTGESTASSIGMTPDEIAAMEKVGKTTPAASYITQHPRIAMGVLGPLIESPMITMGLHGNALGGLATGALAGLGDIGGFLTAGALARHGAGEALNDVSRTVGGVPTGSIAQNALNSPEWRRALQSLMFSGTSP